MPQSQTLEDIFGAFVNQGTLEDAARWMMEETHAFPDLEAEFVSCLSEGILAAVDGSDVVVAAVNRSGYRISSPKDAGKYCSELLSLYNAALRSPSE